MNNWLKKNSYIGVLFTAFIVMAFILLITDKGDTTYDQIEIQYGDTLWTLAEKYRGTISTKDWINNVQLENNLENEIIVVGQQLVVPINENSLHIAHSEETQSVKVASKEQ